jgi:hypothetical protein
MSAPAIATEIEEALHRQGLRPRRLVLISPPDAHKRGRFSYRVEVEGGPTLKARRFETDEAARVNFELRSGLDEAFAAAIAWHGPVLLEAWVDGVPLEGLAPEARVEEAGAVLGRLHARPLATPTPPLGIAAWRERAAEQLQVLASAGMLAPHEVARLGDELCRHDPGSASATLVHQDFCAENMLIDARGRLRVIDNEWIAVGPAGFDLGRSFCRWPMSESAWERFLRAYRAVAPQDAGPLEFWKIVGALFGAHIRLRQAPERLAVPLGLLRRMAGLPGAALRDSS